MHDQRLVGPELGHRRWYVRLSRSIISLRGHPFFFPLFSNVSTLPERTKTRPLARRDISPRQAIAFLVPQLAAGLAVLTQLNWYRCVHPIPSHSMPCYYILCVRLPPPTLLLPTSHLSQIIWDTKFKNKLT
jgi:hypothetical protein